MSNDPQTQDQIAADDDWSAQLQTAITEREDYKDKWVRSLAEFDNYRKRVQREIEDERKFAGVPLLKAVLPGLDGLQRALKAAEASKNVDELIAGVEMVAKQFETALMSVGVQPIVAVGQPFDPNIHEAISQRPSADHPPMTVVDDVEHGYLLHERVIRPSKVIVSSAPQ